MKNIFKGLGLAVLLSTGLSAVHHYDLPEQSIAYIVSLIPVPADKLAFLKKVTLNNSITILDTNKAEVLKQFELFGRETEKKNPFAFGALYGYVEQLLNPPFALFQVLNNPAKLEADYPLMENSLKSVGKVAFDNAYVLINNILEVSKGNAGTTTGGLVSAGTRTLIDTIYNAYQGGAQNHDLDSTVAKAALDGVTLVKDLTETQAGFIEGAAWPVLTRQQGKSYQLSFLLLNNRVPF